MSNPYSIYKANYIDNLPSGVTYDSTIARFFYNGKSFFTPYDVDSYRLYLAKFDVFDLFLNVANGTLVLTGFTATTVTVEVVTPVAFAGSYTITISDLDDGPVFESPPTFTGTTGTGDVATAVSGLVIGNGTTDVGTFTWTGSTTTTGTTRAVLADDQTVGLTLTQNATSADGTTASDPVVVIAQPAYTDSGVSFSSTATLTRNSDLGIGSPGVDHLVVFLSFSITSSSKIVFAEFNSTDKADLRRQSNGAIALGGTTSSGTSNVVSSSGLLTTGTRYNLLGYRGADGTKVVLKSGSGSVTTVIDDAADASGTYLDFGSVINMKGGTLYRAAAFTPSSSIDPADATTFGWFADAAGETVDPATSVAQIGTDLFDIHGSAVRYTNGIGGTFTTSGTFTDV